MTQLQAQMDGVAVRAAEERKRDDARREREDRDR